ncbi:hypothetical protein ULO1_11190 [Carboxydocella sp. ULO1]|nr:hypothetical protein ULO1_11190 [Carboxydocella sp. ULO1]
MNTPSERKFLLSWQEFGKEVISRAKNLPRVINPRKDPEWEYTTYCLADGSYVRGVIPKKYISRYEIAFSLNTENKDGIIEKKQLKTHVMTEYA